MIDEELQAAARTTLDAARSIGAVIVTAESCTGGLVAGTLTAIAGSSDAVYGGFVTYANEAKLALGVPRDLLEAHGAVSEPVARAMAEWARTRAMEAGFATVVSVAITGVAGPGGGSIQKPVGLVHFAAGASTGTKHKEMRYTDIGRSEIRRASVLTALSLICEAING